MYETRFTLKVTIAPDQLPGTCHTIGDFIKIIEQSIPPYYLRTVLLEQESINDDHQRPDDEMQKQNSDDIRFYADSLDFPPMDLIKVLCARCGFPTERRNLQYLRDGKGRCSECYKHDKAIMEKVRRTTPQHDAMHDA